MGMQFPRNGRFRVTRQTIRRGDGKHPAVIHDAKDGHVALDPLAETNPGIETGADNIAVRVVDRDFNANSRIFVKKRLDEQGSSLRSQ
jgi:hypothetical protein